MKDTELNARLLALGMPKAKAAELTRKIRDEVHPIAAVAVAKVQRYQTTTEGLGATGVAVASSAASMGTTGAKVGTFFGPGVGTAIGAGIGIAVGVILKQFMNQGQKPQRLAQAKQVLATLRNYPPDQAGRAISWDNKGGGTSDLLFEALYLAGGFLGYQGTVLTDHPSSMWQWTQWFMQGTQKVVQAAYANPVGAQVTVTLMTGYKQNLPFTFTNPGLIDATSFAQSVLMPMVGVIIDGKHTNPAAGVAQSLASVDAIHVFALLYDYYVAQIAPQSLSTNLAQNPVVAVPAAIAQQAQQVAQSIVNTNTTPALVTPATASSFPVAPGPQVLAPDGSVALAQPAVLPGSSSYGAPLVQNPSIPYGPAPGYTYTPTGLPAAQDATAGVMQTMLSQDGTNMTSGPAQQVLADVAAQGVQKTTAGVSSIPGWLLPIVGIAFAGAIVMKEKGK